MIKVIFFVQLDTNEDMSNEKDVDDENEMDDDCNHDIRIHEDLGHVCRICGMIVRKAETIIDYQWKKVRTMFRTCDSSKFSKL